MVIPYLSVCSGIEAFSVAVKPIGNWVPVAFSEIEKFPSNVLKHHWPDVPNLGDFTKIDTKKLPPVWWLVGGTPCQSFSIAGLRKGLSDDRGNLTLEYVRLAHALVKNNGLRGLLWENVPGCLSDKSNAFGCFLAAIVGHDDPLVTPDGGRWPDAGMVAGPRARLAWRILDSQHFGVAQRRRRVFVVADFGNWFDPAAVLFEPGGQVRRAEPRREAEQEVAGTLGGSSQSGGVRTTDLDNNGAFVVAPITPMNSRTGNERTETHSLITVEYLGNAEGGNAEAPSLNASNGAKGINNQTPLIMVSDIAPTLRAGGNSTGGHRPPGSDVDTVETLVVYSLMPQNSGKDFKAREVDVVQPILAGGQNNSDQGGDLVVAFNLRGREGGNMPELGGDQASALRSADGGSSMPMALVGPQVRRLTPVECERLQGYPDNHTLIPGLTGWRDVGDDENPDDLIAAGLIVRATKKTGKLRVNDPDGPRYKALGNSFTTEPVNWIMNRVTASLAGLPMPDWHPMHLWLKPR